MSGHVLFVLMSNAYPQREGVDGVKGQMTLLPEIIKTISFSQDQIMEWIIKLYCPEGFELDPTYSVGNFYKRIPEPKYKFDLYPQTAGVIKADARALPVKSESIRTIMFDPPFLVGGWTAGKSPGIMKLKYGYYKNITSLWNMYAGALKELHRILKPRGILIFKCQDTISGRKQYFSHIEIYNLAIKQGFYVKDLFILLARNRAIGFNHHNQQHARKYHSYFWVFIKIKSKVFYRHINQCPT